MSNMSYCRFENTLSDLRDCWEAWNEPESELNESEKKAKERISKLVKEMAEDII